MNLNNIFKKVSGVALAATLAFGGFSTVANAATGPTVTKTVGDGTQYFGGGTFNFTLGKGTVADTEYAGFNKPANNYNLVTLSSNSISVPAGTGTEGTLTVNYADPGDLTNVPTGVYRYTLTEDDIDTTANPNLAGIAKDGSTFNIDVFVVNDGNGGKEIANIIVTKSGETGKVSDFDTNNITNNNGFTFNNTIESNQVTVSKTITGNQANMDDTFTFTFGIGTANKSIRYSVDGGQNWTTLENGTTTVDLGNGDSFVIDGISNTDQLTVSEDKKDYNTTINGTADDDGSITTNYAGTNNGALEFVNSRDTNVPTGLIENIAPFVLAIATAGVIFFVYFKRDKEEEQLA